MKALNTLDYTAYGLRDGNRLPLTMTLAERPDGHEIRISSKAKQRPEKIVVTIRDFESISEIFPATPNFNDVRRIPGWLQAHQGIRPEHPDQLFGAQWLFTPAPLVFPMRCGDQWRGIGLGAEPGKNQYIGWTYRPMEGETAFTLEIYYESQWENQGDWCTLFIPNKSHSRPEPIIEDYCNWLRSKEWAPQPERKPAAWWRLPFSQAWGEQCNWVNQRGESLWKPGHSASLLDSQTNEMNWFGRLDEKGIPLGIASLGDKWQLSRHRLVPDPARFHDLRGYADWHHEKGRHLVAWLGMWRPDEAPAEMCVRSPRGDRLTLDPESPAFRKQLQEDVTRLLSPDGYNLDGFFLDFTAEMPADAEPRPANGRWGMELLHEYVRLIHEAAKAAKPDAMILSHCCHPYFADVVDVLRLNDYAFVNPTVVAQMRYRAAIAKATSDWLINTDGWCMYDINEWRQALQAAPEIGIPATWFTHGVFGEGIRTYEPFTEKDYADWKATWTTYRERL